ncbi:hypothetical protein RR46_05763 [Papilio xuthus]|uniref:Uncharacterized protein n=1 Tax=Papilio xuthus TaxID=66420 RepID=A0A194PM47_PAPXU|nr:hypothetical protein RR46_05763 [Papilio xuthus]
MVAVRQRGGGRMEPPAVQPFNGHGCFFICCKVARRARAAVPTCPTSTCASGCIVRVHLATYYLLVCSGEHHCAAAYKQGSTTTTYSRQYNIHIFPLHKLQTIIIMTNLCLSNPADRLLTIIVWS